MRKATSVTFWGGEGADHITGESKNVEDVAVRWSHA